MAKKLPSQPDPIPYEPDFMPSAAPTDPLLVRAEKGAERRKAAERKGLARAVREGNLRAEREAGAPPRRLGKEASIVLKAWHAGQQELARELLAHFRGGGKPGRPGADWEHYMLARLVHGKLSELREANPENRVLMKTVYGLVVLETGQKERTLKRAYQKFRTGFERIDKAAALLAEADK